MNDHPASEMDVLIRARGLNIGYKKETIVADLNFQVERGQSLALVGVNGSGKSTLLKTLVGLLPPLQGELAILGQAPGKTSRQIAYLSQFHTSGFILPLRAVDVVRMGRFAEHGLLGKMTTEDEALVEQSMDRMGINQLADQPLRSLSGGQLQRVHIAQVLARRANLLILDEPTAGLDAGGKEIYKKAVREELARGATVVVATHDLQEAMQCNQAMLLARKVIAIGRGQEIITTEALLEAFGMVITFNNQNHGAVVVDREHEHPTDR
jgi:ABC-type Mn2+/Zn2+ transport system ATPase subunit